MTFVFPFNRKPNIKADGGVFGGLKRESVLRAAAFKPSVTYEWLCHFTMVELNQDT